MGNNPKICTKHILCTECPFKLGSRGKFFSCIYGKIRRHTNKHEIKVLRNA